MRKYRDIKHVITKVRKNYLVLEPNYHTKNFFSECLLATEMKKTQIFMNKAVYLGVGRLEISRNVVYEIWYCYVKPKCEEKAKRCYVDADSFIVHIKTEDIYVDIAKDVEARFGSSNSEVERPLPKDKSA